MSDNGSWSGDRRSFPKAIRAAILRRDPVCRCAGCPECSRGGCGRASTEADHVVSLAACLRAGVNPDTIENGRGLCAPCHAIKTRLEQQAGRDRMKGKRPPRPHPAAGW